MATGPESTRKPPLASSAPAAAEGEQLKRLLPLATAMILVALSVAVRIAYRQVITSDLEFYVLRWYAKFQQLGIGPGLGKDFYNYSPPYMYLLALCTLSSRFVSPVTAVKLLSVMFDIYAAFVIYRIVRLKFSHGYVPYLAAAVFFAAPTIVVNSSVWGQADSTYTGFLLTTIYFLLLDRPLPAILFFSIAFAFKPQAIFMAPFLMLLIFRKRIRWYLVFLVPLIYAAAALPAVVLGRTWLEILTIYLSRPASGKALTHNAATLYVFVPRSALSVLIGTGVLMGALIVLAWLLFSWFGTKRLDRPAILLMALVSVGLTPFVLPNMHDRYFYPADAISIAVAFWMPELWIIPILFQLISGLSYSIYLLAASPDNLAVASILNAFTLAVLLAKQISWNRQAAAPASPDASPA